MTKDFKIPVAKELRGVHYRSEKPGYFCDMQHFKITRIMTSNITRGHIRFLETSYNFWNAYINRSITSNLKMLPM